VVFNDGAVGAVTGATATSLTVTFSIKPKTAGSLTAVVTTDAQSSGAAVQVATIMPVVTTRTVSLAASAATFTFNGFGFDPTAAHNTVVLNDGAVGTVTAASATSLTVTFSTKPTAVGNLTAVVTTNSVSSGAAVQVATVAPAVTVSTASQSVNTTTVTINGAGFDTTPGNNTVVFNDGAVGTVTAATATSLTVTFSTQPTTGGKLTAVVTTNSVSSGAAIQVAAVAPIVTSNTASQSIAATTVTISGVGFDAIAGHNTVVFSNGAVGTVTAATATSLTVTFSTKPKTTGNLTAVVTTNSVSSGVAVQVATVI
ncbi:MAG TPA: IPT/TIG domain-containing protein, partial [Pirellulales bacterium]|nr:IPT/TIG domain-containing protein [Pirellulales bacterium]